MSFKEAFLKAFKPRSKLTGSQWADKYRYVAPSTSPEPGEWRTSRVPYLREPMDSATDKRTEVVVMCCSSQVGKALTLDTPLPTPKGWVSMGDLKVGDRLFDENGKTCKVLAKTDIMYNHKVYRVEFSDGTSIKADAGHKWQVTSDFLHYENGQAVYHKGERVSVLNTEQMKLVHAECKKHGRNAFKIPVAKALDINESDLLIKPYTLGVWLGDGHQYSGNYCGPVSDFDIAENIKKDGYELEIKFRNDLKVYDATINPQYLKNKYKNYRTFHSDLRALNLIKNKHIPNQYLRASAHQRWELLRGLMDTDGTSSKKGLCSITLKDKTLVYQCLELIRSLGLKPTIHKKIAKIKSINYECLVYVIHFVAYQDQKIFKLKRKQERLKDRAQGRLGEVCYRRITSITEIESEPVQCITVDSDSHLFLAGEAMVPTHNSEILLNIMGYYVDQEPAPQLMLQPTLEAAENFSKERIEPTFKYSEGLRNKLEEGQDGRGTSRKSSTTIRMKHYAGGYLALVGANSPAGLASRPIRVLLCDEIDRYGVTKEGDPLKLAIQRTTNFNNRKIILVSTPTIKGISKIDEWYEKSDKRVFKVPCPECGEFFEYKWEYVKWDKDLDNNADIMSAGIYCPHCGKKVRGAYKPDPTILQQGKWFVTNRDSTIKGYHINSLYSPWVDLYKLVEEFLTAKHNRDKNGLMEFINLKLGEAWNEEVTDGNFWERLLSRREYYPKENVLPPNVLLLTAGVDVQRDRVECSVYGWGVGKECWGIEHRILFGSPDRPEVWAQLDELLTKKYIMPNGCVQNIACACVDSGDGAYTADVYRYTKAREHLRVFSIKGRGGANVPFINNPSKNNSVGATLIHLGVDAGKSLLMSRLHVETEGPNYVHFSQRIEDGFGEEFFKQLTAEVIEKKFEKGRLSMAWIKLRERNEALDCAVYASAAIEIINPNFEQFAEFYAKGGNMINATTTQAPKKKRTISRGVTF